MNKLILKILLFSNFLIFTSTFSQTDCSEVLHIQLDQDKNDVELLLVNMWPSQSLCPTLSVSIRRISYLNAAPDSPVVTTIADNELVSIAEIYFGYKDIDLEPGRHQYFASILMDDGVTIYEIESLEVVVEASSFDIVWTDKVGVYQSYGRLIKTTRTGVNCNSGAASVNTIPANENGWVEMTVSENWRTKFFGLSNRNANACRWTISHSVFFNGDKLQIYEGGRWIGYFANYAIGDVIRVERIGAKIYYMKNGVTFYSSYKPSYGSLIADVTITTQYGIIGWSRCSHSAAGSNLVSQISDTNSVFLENKFSENKSRDSESDDSALLVNDNEVYDLLSDGLDHEASNNSEVNLKTELRNYPNPFHGQTNIEFKLDEDADVTLTISDMNGKKISVLLDKKRYNNGTHQVIFDASDHPQGIYYYTLQARNFISTKKMMLMNN